jgi:capsular polysaccharide biosynthesis protein
MFSKLTKALRYVSGETQHRVAWVVQQALRLVGRDMLNPRETAECLSLFAGAQHSPTSLMQLRTKFEGIKQLEIMGSGLIRVNGRKWLDLDYGTRAGLFDWSKPRTAYPRAAAVWSHRWMGYYHWIIDILPKICLLQRQFGPDLDGLKICYPSSGSVFEQESLKLLGVPSTAVHCTRKHGAVNADEIWCNQLPGWQKIHPMAKLVQERLLPFKTAGSAKRIYLSRRGRRRCLNEYEVEVLLKKHGFLVVEDNSRSLSEQIGLFYDADYIIAPHGAALTNLLWCRPGAHVLEFFNASYQADYYRHLSEYGGLHYRCLIFGAHGGSHWSAVSDPIRVDLHAFAQAVDEMTSQAR